MQGRIEVQGGGDLDDLLMTPLDGAIALEEVDESAAAVAEELDLDVSGATDEFFEEDIGDAEGGAGLASGLIEGVVELIGGEGDAHTAAAAAHRRLDDDGEAEPLGERVGFFAGTDGRVAAGQDRDAGLLGDAAGRYLVAELFEDLGAWADEDDAGVTNRPGELRVFGEETIAGMDRVDFVFAGQGDDAGNVEVGADGFAGLADAVGLVGFEAVQGEAILVGVQRDGANAQLMRGAEDADGDLAAVGDEQLLDRRGGCGGRILRHGGSFL